MEEWNLDFDALVNELKSLSDEEIALGQQISKILNASQLSAYEKNKVLCVIDKVLYHKTLGVPLADLLN